MEITTVDRNAYYCIDVKMKHGFQYTMYLKGHAVSSMKKFVESMYWTESILLRESSEEEHLKALEETPKASKKDIGFSSLDNFFQEEKPKRKKAK